MRFNVKDYAEWHPHFALFPTLCSIGPDGQPFGATPWGPCKWVWLEWVERRMDDGSYYRLRQH